jgi:hypothetical protein
MNNLTVGLARIVERIDFDGHVVARALDEFAYKTDIG